MAPTALDAQLAIKQRAKLSAKLSAVHSRQRSTAPAKSRRPNRREAEEQQSCDSSQERAERKAEERAAKRVAKFEALEREWRVQQVAGELGRQAELLERHRYLVAKYGATHVPHHHDTDPHTRQV